MLSNQKPDKNATEIQLAGQEDIAEILRLQKTCYQQEAAIYNDYTIQPLTQTEEEITKEFSSVTVLKAVADGRIIGSVRAYIKEGTCYIGKVIVHPDHQNQGLGSLLMQAIERRCTQAVRYELFTGAKSKKNLYFYQKLGYRQFKKEKITATLCFVFLEKPNSAVSNE